MKRYKCRTCSATKAADQFGPSVKNLLNDKLNYHCRPCSRTIRQAQREAQFAGMSMEELAALEKKNCQQNREYRARHPERVKAQRVGEKLMENIPKWQVELEELVPLLVEYEAATRSDFEQYGHWPSMLIAPDVGIDLSDRWNEKISKLRWITNNLATLGQSATSRDTVINRIEFLKGKLAAVHADDMKRSRERVERGPQDRDGTTRSQRMEMDVMWVEWKQERAEIRAAWTAAERAADRAWLDAWWFVLKQHTDKDEFTILLSIKVDAKLAEFRRGGCSWGKVASEDAMLFSAECQQQKEDDETHRWRYSQVYPEYLIEEEAKDRRAETVKKFLPDSCS